MKKESLHFKLDGKNIGELALLDITALKKWFEGLETRLNDKQRVIATEVLKEIRKRIGFLLDVGLDYPSLNRPIRTLSGGESQRIRLATQIGAGLVGGLGVVGLLGLVDHAVDVFFVDGGGSRRQDDVIVLVAAGAGVGCLALAGSLQAVGILGGHLWLTVY